MVVSGVKERTPSARSSAPSTRTTAGFPTQRWTPRPRETPPPPDQARPVKPTDDSGRRVAAMAPGEVRDALDDVHATFSPANIDFLRQRGAAKLRPHALPPAPKPRPLAPGAMPTTEAELAAACARLPPSEKAKLDWTAEPDDADAAKHASALSEAFTSSQKELTVTQKRAAFSTLVREVVLEGAMTYEDAPARLLEALARGFADPGKYKKENGRDAVAGLITLLRRSPDYVPSSDDVRAFAGSAWDTSAIAGLIAQGSSDALAIIARAALMSEKAAAALVANGASTQAVRACVAGDANGALAVAALVERGAPLADARAAMGACVACDDDAWALAAATLATAFAKRVPADGEWPCERVAARAVAAKSTTPACLIAAALLRKCCRGGTAEEAKVADAVAARLASIDGPATLSAFCRAVHASCAARNDYAGALTKLALAATALGPVLERCEAGAADDEDWAAARAGCSLFAAAAARLPTKTAVALGRTKEALAATARASEVRAGRDAVASFYEDTPAPPAAQREADDHVLVDDAADDGRGAFHAAHCFLTRRLGDANAVSFALLAPCACRQARYAAACIEQADLEGDAGLQQRATLALRKGALPFPPAWALAASDGPLPASYVAAIPRGALLAHALRSAARPLVDVDALLRTTVEDITTEDVVECAAFLHEWVQGEATKTPESRRDAAFGATVERLNGLVLAEFPAATKSARLALGLLLAPTFPPGVRAAVWRTSGLAGTAAHLRVDAVACACSPADAELLVDDVLLCLKHDPPANAPCVVLAQQHLAAFLRAAPEGSFARESRANMLREACSAGQLAALGAEQ